MAGAEWKTRHLAEVWFYVWFECGARAVVPWGSSPAEVPKMGSLFGPEVVLHEAFLTPFSPFYKLSSSLIVEIEEGSNGVGWRPVCAARLQCEPRSRGASPRAANLVPSAEVSWFFCLREAEQNPQAASQNVQVGRGAMDSECPGQLVLCWAGSLFSTKRELKGNRGKRGRS